jgi:group I intron endonuclease
MTIKTGIYLIKNRINNKFYIGSASGKRGFRGRWLEHRRTLNLNSHFNPKLQRAWNKYGECNFEFIELDYCIPEQCLSKEQYYFNTLLPEYNVSRNAHSRLGEKLSEKARQNLIGRRWKIRPEGIENMKRAKKGTRPSEECLRLSRISQLRKDRARDAVIKKCSKAIIATNTVTGECLEFSSLKSAGEKLGIHKASISDYLTGKIRTARHNYTFVYKENI